MLNDQRSDKNDHNNQVKCWGENDHGQLGYGDNKRRGTEKGDFDEFYLILNKKGEMGNDLPLVNLGSNLELNYLVIGWLSLFIRYIFCLFNRRYELWGDGKLFKVS